MKKGNKEKRTALHILYHVFTLSFACVMIYPLVWMIMSSFKESGEIFRTAASLIPEPFTLSNYTGGWKGFAGYSFAGFFKNRFPK